MRLVTQTKAAKEVRRSQGYIAKLVKEAKIKRYKGGQVDLDEVVGYIHGVISSAPQNVDNEIASTSSKGLMTYAQAKTAREAYAAKKAKLEVEELEGKLIRIEEVKKSAQNLAVIVQTKLLSLPSKLAPYCIGKDIAQIKTVLENGINEALDELNRREF